MPFFLVSTLFFGCSEKRTYSRIEVLDLAKKEDPSVSILLAEELGKGPRCKTPTGALIYGPGCIGAFRVKVGILDLTVLEFDTEENARNEALRLDQYYKFNWVFDEVAGEPVLENFVKKVYGAKRPKLEEEKAKEKESN